MTTPSNFKLKMQEPAKMAISIRVFLNRGFQVHTGNLKYEPIKAFVFMSFFVRG